MALNRKILLYSIFGYFCLIVYAYYFKFFPTLISPIISNFFILGLLIIILSLLVIQPFQLKSSIDLYCILPQYVIFTFITRAISTLRLPYQPLSDPYYYFITTLNIADYGTLEPVLSWWYSLIPQQLTWPDLHIIGSVLMNLTGIHSLDLLRYVLPVTGIFFFLGVFLLTIKITNNATIGLLAGLFASTSDTVLFYQSEYHPQGIAFIYFVFFIILIIQYFSKPTLINGSLMIIYVITFSLSHHFSSIFFGLLSIFILIVLLIFQNYFSRYFQFNTSTQFNFLFQPWIIIIILMFFSHIFKYPAFLTLASNVIMNELKPPGTLITYGSDIPIQVTILNSTKYILIALALVSILYIYKSKNKKEFFCFVILMGILMSGIIGTFVAFIPVDRLIGFYIPFAALFGALTLSRFHDIWFPKWNIIIKNYIIVIISLLILIAGPLNFFAPALIFHDSAKNSYYWHSNDFSGFSFYGTPGIWIQEYIPENSKFLSIGDTFMIPYFYGQIPSTISSLRINSIKDNYYSIFSMDIMKEKNQIKPNLKLIKNNFIYTIGEYNIGINSGNISSELYR